MTTLLGKSRISCIHVVHYPVGYKLFTTCPQSCLTNLANLSFEVSLLEFESSLSGVISLGSRTSRTHLRRTGNESGTLDDEVLLAQGR